MIIEKMIQELPFSLPGRVFRSPMPFSIYDPRGEILSDYLAEHIYLVVVLAESGEIYSNTKTDLLGVYAQNKLEVIHFPIWDYSIPDRDGLRSTLDRVIRITRSGKNVAVHCHAGVGRTGLFAACMSQEVFDLSGEESIEWVRNQISGAIETDEQERFVMGYRREGG